VNVLPTISKEAKLFANEHVRFGCHRRNMTPISDAGVERDEPAYRALREGWTVFRFVRDPDKLSGGRLYLLCGI
jgi:hypothetical protein